MLSPFSDVPHVSRVSSDPIVRLEDYTRSEEIDLLDEGIDRYLSIRRSRHSKLDSSKKAAGCFREERALN
jgi:hypothetical protein